MIDRQKLYKQGYEFWRSRDVTNYKTGKTKFCIYVSNEFGSWKKLHEFETKEGRDNILKMIDNAYDKVIIEN